MSITSEYFETVKDFRDHLRAYHKAYEDGMKKIERYKGSAAFDAEEKELRTTLKNNIAVSQSETLAKLTKLCVVMQEKLDSQPLVPPTDEQLNLLNALKMREKISFDELKQASRSLESCPAALSVLEEIAQKQGHMGFRTEKPSTSELLDAVRVLAVNSEKLCRIEKPDSRRDYIAKSSRYSTEYDNGKSLELFFVDKDFSNENECIQSLSGGCDFDALAEIVDS